MQIFRLNVLVTKSSERHLIHYLNILSNCDFSPGRLDAKSGLQIQHNTVCQPVWKTWYKYKHFFRFISFDCVKLTHDSRLSYHCRECKTSMQVLKNCFTSQWSFQQKCTPHSKCLRDCCMRSAVALLVLCTTVWSPAAQWKTELNQPLPYGWHNLFRTLYPVYDISATIIPTYKICTF